MDQALLQLQNMPEETAEALSSSLQSWYFTSIVGGIIAGAFLVIGILYLCDKFPAKKKQWEIKAGRKYQIINGLETIAFAIIASSFSYFLSLDNLQALIYGASNYDSVITVLIIATVAIALLDVIYSFYTRAKYTKKTNKRH